MNRLLLLLFISGALLSMMALVPEGHSEKSPIKYDTAVERTPSAMPIIPPSGEPSDNGLTENMQKEFRETLHRDPSAAITLARQYLFTNELDRNFRLSVLRDLRSVQFTEPGVFELAGEIIEKNPDIRLTEEALGIKSAILSEEEFGLMLQEISGKTDSPEILAVIRTFN